MNYQLQNKTKKIAKFLLAVWLLNLVEPLSAYALTSGPNQPESQSFQAVGTSDMVDLFSGDFKYNIPLMDVDGYPLNLNYQSGVGMEDEASWVGLGWNLNVGSINRQLRGIPDDFKGDEIKTEQKTKDRITIGGKLTAKAELTGKYKSTLIPAWLTSFLMPLPYESKLKPSGSFTFGIFSDNYTGIGAEIGANVGISYSFGGSGLFTSSMGLGVLSNTASGVDVSPNISTSISAFKAEKINTNAGFSSSLGYNSRAGLKTWGLGSSINSYQISTPLVSYNTEAILPKIQIPYKSTNNSFSLDAGFTAAIFFVGGGATGYIKNQSLAANSFVNPEYGFLYSESGKNSLNAIHDFIREKENPVIPELPNLALPIATPDIFTFNSHVGSGQFRLYRGGTGVFYDNAITEGSENNSIGADFGWGVGYHGGVTKFDQSIKNTTRKWTKNNDYLAKGDFQNQSENAPNYQHVFFRKPDEKNIEDTVLNGKNGIIRGTEPLMIGTSGVSANSSFKTKTSFGSNVYAIPNKIEKHKRQEQSTSISYLTASEASKVGLDKTINIYPFNDASSFYPGSTEAYYASSRVDANVDPSTQLKTKKAHHISEITVLNEQGQRSVYGLPVYNKIQQEITFAVGNGGSIINGRVPMNNLASGNFDPNVGGIDDSDNYFHRDTQPGYASSYLLTGILSPDFVDKTGDGITADDSGTAIKFKYSKDRNKDYKWRTPYNSGATPEAALNRGLLADSKDDKGSIIYGEKEIYYVHSIESKTKIAYFITEDRDDALGVSDINGGRDPYNPDLRQKRLKEIRLYSKANLQKPIKVVKFDYTYELCTGAPNSMNGGGKLTLTKVWFEYGNTQKGMNHPYKFSYDINQPYELQSMDRWGTYKNRFLNYGSLTNEQYPYANQNKQQADQAASFWQLKIIELPSGGSINVKYESDDYAYVQDKRASVMVPFDFKESDIKSGNASIIVDIDVMPPDGVDWTSWFKNIYLNGSDYIYTKSWVKLSTSNADSEGNDYDFVSTYAKVTQVTNISNNKATIKLESINEGGVTTNPIRFAAWQKMKNEYPKYAYPGYKNKAGANDSGMGAIVRAIGSASRNLNELWENFYQRADRKSGFCDDFKPEKSFARIAKASGYKLGGGTRVKQIKIVDEWDSFTGTNTPKGVYGQRYEYTTKDVNGGTISSGVATYEPAIGNDENSLKQPIPYIQKIKGAINNYFELEAPFGESLYPAPSVGYSKVTVKDLEGADDTQPDIPATGFTVQEFYTAKDFPVKVTVLPMDKYNPKPESTYSLIRTNSIEEMVLSQGYSIELNDMHGKPKADRVFNTSSVEISSTEYHYHGEKENSKEQKFALDNKVNVVSPNGEVEQVVVGRDIEFFTDFREQETINSGRTINLGVDYVPIFFAPLGFPIPHWPMNDNNEYKLFRSACAVKVIQTNGILSKVVKNENGSSISVENIAFDGVTGEALVTKTQNEFNKSYFTVNLPAYWPYRKMGGAYQNIGVMLQKVNLNNYKELNEEYWPLLTEGDELVNIGSGESYWVVDVSRETTFIVLNGKKLIDRKGARLETIADGAENHTFKIVRSGFRNILSASAENIVCLNNPIVNGRLVFYDNANHADLKIINASSTSYDDEWPVDGKGQVVNRKEYFDAEHAFTYKLSGYNSEWSKLGSRIYSVSPDSEEAYGLTIDNVFDNYINFSNEYLNLRLINAGIWPNSLALPNVSSSNEVNFSDEESLGFKATFYAPESKYYYIGFAGDDRLQVRINGINAVPALDNTYQRWTIYPYYIQEGINTIEVEGYNQANEHSNWSGNPGGMGVEIYNNNGNQLRYASGSSGINTIFSTGSLISDQSNFQTFRTINGVKTWRFSEEAYFNPFVQGMKGNWRPYTQNVYQENRSYDGILLPGKKGVNVANSGYLTSFMSYWVIQSSAEWGVSSSIKWVKTNTIKQYDKYGQESENQDALKRYSAASFDFAGQLPAAVASNAMRREIYANSFEDVARINTLPDSKENKEFVANGYPLSYYRVSNDSHSGNYSIALPTSGIQLVTRKHTTEQKDSSKPFLGRTSKNEFTLMNTEGLYPTGFEPKPTGQYLISMWVKDAQPLNKNVNVQVNVGNANATLAVTTLTCKAVVEGWKLIEGTFAIPYSSNNNRFDIAITPSFSGIYLDDVRVHPKDAHMKTYVYDDLSYRLMAELDENAFATFYEYDEEGSLVRVKKETERGIATLKENHSSYRKKSTL
ncbi:hypothetical protein [Pedobacter sp. MW01-1-1]|uniref:hypothetical protein n=1 Tax=Pedobacter sp. MW01-1-1 TaxID=3383027 RepID=UPI003FEDD038